MSDSLAIAAVTATLRELLFTAVNADVPGTDVIARPPDRATVGQGNRLNVFLYQTSLDAAWRNQEIPGRAQPGEDGRPPLPLSLYYLITAYPAEDDEIVAHRMLGRAMSVLHDHPLLGAAEIKAALVESDLAEQVERVRITPQPMTLEEMSKLWTTFQTQYRISAAYQVCVVLIESRLPVRSPVPVLARGNATDVGVVVQPSTLPPIPMVTGLELPDGEPSAEPGDAVRLEGHHLDAIETIVIDHRRLADPLPIALAAGAATWDAIEFALPAGPNALPAGLCSLRGLTAAGDAGPGTNEVALAVAPRLTSAGATRDPGGAVTVSVDCDPAVVDGQDVLLLLGDRSVAPESFIAPATALDFEVGDIPAGDYLLRLRVDGIDSHLVDRSTTPPVFDPTQKVSVP